MHRACLVVVLFLLGGCPEPVGSPPSSSERCERLGDRCQTEQGPIGICNQRPGPCEAPPCLACMPQH